MGLEEKWKIFNTDISNDNIIIIIVDAPCNLLCAIYHVCCGIYAQLFKITFIF